MESKKTFSLGKRISILVDFIGGQEKFAQFLNIGRSNIPSWINDKTKPNYNFFEQIFTKMPNLYERWLLLGQGNMWRDEAKVSREFILKASVENETPTFEPSPEEVCKHIITENERLKTENQSLKNSLESVQKSFDIIAKSYSFLENQYNKINKDQ